MEGQNIMKIETLLSRTLEETRDCLGHQAEVRDVTWLIDSKNMIINIKHEFEPLTCLESPCL